MNTEESFFYLYAFISSIGLAYASRPRVRQSSPLLSLFSTPPFPPPTLSQKKPPFGALKQAVIFICIIYEKPITTNCIGASLLPVCVLSVYF